MPSDTVAPTATTSGSSLRRDAIDLTWGWGLPAMTFIIVAVLWQLVAISNP
jgi:NitT/TauT family transport system permease protein